MAEIKGYILTREHTSQRGCCLLRYIGVSDLGPFEVIITRERPLFFVGSSTRLPKNIQFHERRNLKLATFDGMPVDALYFKSQPDLYRVRRQLREAGIRTFEADILPEDRYLMERFIYGNVSIKGTCRIREQVHCFEDPVLSPADYLPSFSVLSLDIETGRKGELYSIACWFHGKKTNANSTASGAFGIVLMQDSATVDTSRSESFMPFDTGLKGISPEPLDNTGWMVRLPGEKKLLMGFLDMIYTLDPDIIIGWHVIGFDLQFLEKKCREHRLRFSIGRGRTVPEIREIRKGMFSADLSGRLVIDGPPSMRAAFYSFDNFRLETVASELLGRGKDIGKEKDKVAEIERRFREDKKALARYNLLDSILVWDIFEKAGLVDLIAERAKLSGLTMDRVGRSVAAFDHFMLPRIHRNGFVAPNVSDIKDIGHAPGGLVFIKAPGFYEQIAVFDFKSLYPSIIRTFKIDPLSLLKAEEKPLSTPVGTQFSRQAHVLPDFIRTLMQTRETAKRAGDLHLSQAVKILMNSFYGVMGTLKSRFYNPELSRSITGTGRWLLKSTRRFLEEKGYSVLYGDTDSVFVQLKRSEFENGEQAAEKLARQINAFLSQTIKERFDLESQLEIEFEKLFIRFFLPALRGGGDGVKKRYAGLVKRGDTKELVFTGLEFVRSDWTRFARQFQYDLFERIFNDREVAPWIRRTISKLKQHHYDRDLVYQKRLTKSPEAYVKVVPPHVKAARLLESGFENLGEISYVMTMRGPVPTDLPHDDLDYNHYIEKQLKPIADAVLLFFDLSVREIMGGKQLDLF